MKIYKTRIFGFFMMIILITGGSLLGGFTSLNSMYSDLEQTFMNGEYSDGMCIMNDLNERAGCAANMITIAGRYDVDSDLTEALQTAIDDMNSSYEMNDRFEANQKLQSAMDTLYNALKDQELSKTDSQYRESVYDEFNSRADSISHDAYNTKAASYNAILTGFPANIISALTPADKAVLFY